MEIFRDGKACSNLVGTPADLGVHNIKMNLTELG
jgi:hypothetical protein